MPGGLIHPLLSREPLVVETRARRLSNALDKALQNHVSELKIEVTCEVKVRSKVKIRRFDVLGLGTRIIEPDGSNSGKMLSKHVKVWYEYEWHTKKTSRSRSGHKRSLYVRIVIKSCDTFFMAQFRRRTRNHG